MDSDNASKIQLAINVPFYGQAVGLFMITFGVILSIVNFLKKYFLLDYENSKTQPPKSLQNAKESDGDQKENLDPLI